MAPSTLRPPVLDTFQAVVAEFSEFLTVAIHTILYERDIYPRTSFLSARKYNYSVRQNRHPEVCKWIQDAVAAVEVEMLKGTISQTSLIIYSPLSIPLERFIFSTAAFPIIPRNEFYTTIEIPTTDPVPPPPPTTTTTTTTSPPPNLPPPPIAPAPIPLPTSLPPTPLINLHMQFRSLFARLSTLTGSLKPLPPDCSFTLAIELRDPSERRPDGTPAGEPPIGHPMPWIAAEPGLQRKNNDELAAEAEGSGSIDVTQGSSSHGLGFSSDELPASGAEAKLSAEGVNSENHEGKGKGASGIQPKKYVSQKGKYVGGQRTTPVRSVEAGPFVMEFWVEEGREKAEAVRVARLEAEAEEGFENGREKG